MRPFDQANALAKKVFLQAEIVGLLLRGNAIKVKMKNWQAASIFIYQCKSRTCYKLRYAKAGAHSFDARCLAGAKIAVKAYNGIRF